MKQYPPRVPLVTDVKGLWWTFKAARRNLLELIPEIATRQPVVSGKIFTARWHMVTDPALLKRILLENLDNFPKSDVTKNILRPAIGDSLFIAEGAHWRWQRRAAAPVFSHRNVQALAPIMVQAAENAAKRMDGHVGRAAEMYEEMVSATFEVIADVTFSGDESFDSAAVHKAIDAFIDSTGKTSLLDLLDVPTWVPRPSRLFSPNSLKLTKSIADKSIAHRHETGTRKVPDLLDLLIDGEDPKSGRKMNQAEIRDNLLAFIVAGHETTALTLAWAIYLLGFDPSVQGKARQEVREQIGDRPVTVEDVENLPYLRMIIDETLRLYPPAAFLSRTAQGPDQFYDRDIKKGDTVILPIYALHRHHDIWEDPDRFDPERFRHPKSIDRFAYLPFGNGPRVCIGAQFALQEAIIILATLLNRFQFETIPGKSPSPELLITLRPEGGAWLKVEKAL